MVMQIKLVVVVEVIPPVKSDFVSYLLGSLFNGPVAINRHMVQNRDVLKRGTVKTHDIEQFSISF